MLVYEIHMKSVIKQICIGNKVMKKLESSANF